MDYQKILNALLKKDKFLITTHVTPDLDGIGAELALNYLLVSQGKDSIILNHDYFDANNLLLEDSGPIYHGEEHDFTREDLKSRNVVVLDNSELNRIGFVNKYVAKDYSNLFIIDHHDDIELKNENHFVNAVASSTCEMIYELCELKNLVLSLGIQKALYAGIVTDTGHFRYSKTSLRTHEIAIELLRNGVKPHIISEEISSRWPMERLHNKQILYSNLHFDKTAQIAWFAVKYKELYSSKKGNTYTDGIINELLEFESIKVVIFFKEVTVAIQEEGETKQVIKTRLSLRSKSSVDILPIVQHFQGGGHKNACGATLDSNLQESIEAVTSLIKDLLKE